MAPIPISVFTGFLGAGKTTTILNLLPLLPKDYKVVLLKNEFGDVEVDSKLAQQSSLAAVSEILNGCMCVRRCHLVLCSSCAGAVCSSGRCRRRSSRYAVRPLFIVRSRLIPRRQLSPGSHHHRVLVSASLDPRTILILYSGSAFPATLAFQIRQLAQDTGDFVLDAIITVVDAENFAGYEDDSPTARMQASYSDIILIVRPSPPSLPSLTTRRTNGNTSPSAISTS